MKAMLSLILGLNIIQTAAVDAQNRAVTWFALSGGFAITPAQSGRMLMMSEGESFVGRASGPSQILEGGFLVHPQFRTILVSVPQEREVPEDFSLDQNYPNPFNPSTTIKYQLAEKRRVTLKIYDLLGREMATLVDDLEEPGYKSVRWYAAGFASGVYFYRLDSGTFTSVKKLLLLK
jgi:hypothetical protein